MFSAGHTGATVLARACGLRDAAGGRAPGAGRPDPHRRRHGCPARRGANVECRPLAPRALRGHGHRVRPRRARAAEPRVALLSIGEEETKGNDLTREAHQLLKGTGLPSWGNLEAQALFSGNADVIVCDGFTGNVALKVSEGLVDAVARLLQAEVAATFPAQANDPLARAARSAGSGGE